MAKYTMELREIISTLGEDEVKSWFMDYNLSDYLSQDEINVIEQKGVWSKEQLADRIITHFKMREIGVETPAMFILMAKDLMAEVMETYVPLIYSASIKYDPLVNVDYIEQFDRTSSNNSKSNSQSVNNGSGLTVSSDTPQGEIVKSEILAGKYATSTNANETGNTINDTSSNEGQGAENYTKRIKGNSGVSATAQRMVLQYRENIRALNTEIVYKLEPLFMGLY